MALQRCRPHFAPFHVSPALQVHLLITLPVPARPCLPVPHLGNSPPPQQLLVNCLPICPGRRLILPPASVLLLPTAAHLGEDEEDDAASVTSALQALKPALQFHHTAAPVPAPKHTWWIPWPSHGTQVGCTVTPCIELGHHPSTPSHPLGTLGTPICWGSLGTLEPGSPTCALLLGAAGPAPTLPDTAVPMAEGTLCLAEPARSPRCAAQPCAHLGLLTSMGRGGNHAPGCWEVLQSGNPGRD